MAEEKAVATINNAQPPEVSFSTRFTNRVLQEFGLRAGETVPEVTEHQRQLIQGYFITIDRALKNAEAERLRKNENNTDHKYDNPLPCEWKNVNLEELAVDLMYYARLGLDMLMDNMLFPIPFKNNKKEKYDITLMEGYNGIRYIAEKYALEPPTAVTVEVVYSTDEFQPIKKDRQNRTENYDFKITRPFDRGDIVGGFAYLEFTKPEKNELIMLSMKDIEKRKPAYASPNFWGGKKTDWQYENGKRKKVEVETEGWLDEMVRKTIIREAYSAKHIPRDPQKIDDTYQQLKMREAKYAAIAAQAEIDANANTITIDTTPLEEPIPEPQALPEAREYVDLETGEVLAMKQPEPEPVKPAPTLGPDF